MDIWPVLLVSAVALCLGSLCLLFCSLILLGIFLKWQQPATPNPAPSAVKQPEIKPDRKALLTKATTDKACAHCGRKLKEDPVRGIVEDEKSFLVYKCKCGKETKLPGDPANLPV